MPDPQQTECGSKKGEDSVSSVSPQCGASIHMPGPPLQIWAGHSSFWPWATLTGSRPYHPKSLHFVPWTPWNLRKTGPRGTPIAVMDCGLCIMDHILSKTQYGRYGQIFK
ncbi:hypothetical protein O181_006734 [Austropuccinia psidii MF-1]|uniref:Uncharacterized protein n=1 Tax=Austropuccinia psidii MF-1 TaxID=1389203 RepID=A0A9Q3GH64_9BASI|nr:hypothetical protein [Austropuccinia psidii MF-1]